jgi:hypothetical protein
MAVKRPFNLGGGGGGRIGHTFFTEVLDYSSLQRCYFGVDTAVFEGELHINRTKMRKPAEPLIGLKGHKFFRVFLLDATR